MTTQPVCRESVCETPISVRGVYATVAMMVLVDMVAVAAVTASVVLYQPIRGTERVGVPPRPRST